MIEALVQYYSQIFYALGQTFLMVLISTTFSIMIGVPLGIILSVTKRDGYVPNSSLFWIVTIIVNIIRSVPFILLMIILIPVSHFLFGTGFGMIASIFSLSIIGLSIMARLSENAFISADAELYCLGTSLNFGLIKTFYKIILPEIMPALILSITNLVITLIAYSMIVGIINGGGIGTIVINQLTGAWNWSLLWLVVIVMIIVISLIQIIGTVLARLVNKA